MRQKIHHDRCQIVDTRHRHLGDEHLAATGDTGRIDNQLHRLLTTHDEAGHLRVGQGDGAALGYLAVEDGQHRTARAENVAETGRGVDLVLGPWINVGRRYQALPHEL